MCRRGSLYFDEELDISFEMTISLAAEGFRGRAGLNMLLSWLISVVGYGLTFFMTLQGSAGTSPCSLLAIITVQEELIIINTTRRESTLLHLRESHTLS